MREKKPIDMNLVLLKAENIELKAELKTLKEQIEKMKCCENCKHKNFSFSPFCQKS